MQHITDAMIDELVTPEAAQDVLGQAFRQFGQGRAAMQQRIRTEANGVKLSTLGAVIPDQGVVGAKVYTTLSGKFQFVILLFSSEDGRPLATLDAGAITRLRTAACSVLAARSLARSDAHVLGLFGAGTQGFEHAVQLSAALGLTRVVVNDPYAPTDLADRLAGATGISVALASPEDLVAQADIIVTASRSTTPLFSGESVRPGTFVAAIGSSLPNTRELDDALLSRAEAIIVEWREQTLLEAGDLVLAHPDVNVQAKLVELADLLNRESVARTNPDDIYLYKSVGVGLEDIALAGWAYRLLVTGTTI